MRASLFGIVVMLVVFAGVFTLAGSGFAGGDDAATRDQTDTENVTVDYSQNVTLANVSEDRLVSASVDSVTVNGTDLIAGTDYEAVLEGPDAPAVNFLNTSQTDEGDTATARFQVETVSESSTLFGPLFGQVAAGLFILILLPVGLLILTWAKEVTP